jgi:hypothetical protein
MGKVELKRFPFDTPMALDMTCEYPQFHKPAADVKTYSFRCRGSRLSRVFYMH